MANVDEAGTRRRRWFRRPGRPSAETVRLAALALLAGAALNLAFAPIGWWPVAPLAVAAFSALVAGRTGRRGLLIGFWFGTGFCWVMFQWLRVFGPGAQEAVGIVESLYFVPFGWGMARVSVMRFAPLWQACLWVTEEYGRSRWPFGGFSWGRLAFSQPDSPFTPLAAVGGAPLVTFAVALSGALLWRAALIVWRERQAGTLGAGFGQTGTRWAAVMVVGALVIPSLGFAVPLTSPDSGPPVRIALIQGNVPRVGFGRDEQEAAVLDNHIKETEVLAADIRSGKAAKPDFVVWPENGSDMDPYSDPGVAGQIQQAVDDVGVPVLVGAVINANAAGTNVLNRLIVWTPDPGGGMGATYDKTHLVPFGEYLPFRGILTKLITRFNMIPRDFVPGHGKGVLTLSGVTVAAVICFEVAYDDVVRNAVKGGGQVLLVPSNNASYMGTGQTYQQLAIARFRAVEHGRWTMEAATSGVSAVIDPHGKILAQTGEYQARYLDMQVRRNTTLSLADRVGAWPEYVFALLGLLAAIGLSGAATTLRRVRALIPGFRTPVDTLPGALDGDGTPSGAAGDADLQTAAKGRAR
ncbi:apolipoprotein N-acyltransferase [Catenulispora sp. NF23]|uniref:Apolipoprotein N-acyltransferase n=1 Tax=Catenulispora pinistramenti TaxID=2705254 RepID=A0ABS5L100_9ACTN|nr:apolipoprotein N-acyltransferase [Catenulispora pinistramenti]MBS2538676.1 apolipoprotein N-acyltransferase [Catenulispora pinistramenti]MBS2552005.1 apolipoprotein N-acyltransferase [Catenulispora pinistramenti]